MPAPASANYYGLDNSMIQTKSSKTPAYHQPEKMVSTYHISCRDGTSLLKASEYQQQNKVTMPNILDRKKQTIFNRPQEKDLTYEPLIKS